MEQMILGTFKDQAQSLKMPAALKLPFSARDGLSLTLSGGGENKDLCLEDRENNKPAQSTRVTGKMAFC